MRFQVLGRFEAVAADGRRLVLGGHQQRLVLACLLVSSPEPVSRDRLMDELWGEQPPATAAHAIQVFVSGIRKLLRDVGENGVEVRTVESGYVLELDPDRVDARRFEALVARGQGVLASDPAGAAEVFGQAIGLWRGTPFVEFISSGFLRGRAAQLEDLRAIAVEGLAEARLACGDHSGELISEISSLVAANPLRERPRQLLMLALYRRGRHADALAAYREGCEALDEIGLRPGPELRQLEQAILRHDESLRNPEDPATAPVERDRSLSPDAAWAGHTVIIGLGSIGWRLASGLHDAGYELVVIERDGDHELIAECQQLGIFVITGDGVDPDVLRAARISCARHLIVTSGDDMVNMSIATVAEAELAVGGPAMLTAFVHVMDLALLRMLKSDAVTGTRRRGFRLEFFNAYATGAQMLLRRYPAFEDRAGSPHPAPRVCVVGRDLIAVTLILSMAAEWQLSLSERGQLPIVLIGPDAAELVDELVTRYPPVAGICSLQARAAHIQSAAFQRGDVLLDPDGGCTVTIAYVALPSESDALSAALGLHGQPATAAVPVVVAVNDADSAIAKVLRAEGRTVARNVEAFGVLSSALAPTILLGGVTELLARANHETYLREQRAVGVSGGASMVDWEELAESLKNSNRRFADGLGAALEAVGCAPVPGLLIDASHSLTGFTEDEIEVLARREHGRWMSDLTHDGWRLNPGGKDPERKLHPLLVPWDQLSDAERSKDRDAVRAIPQMMMKAGFEIMRWRGPTEGQRGPSAETG